MGRQGVIAPCQPYQNNLAQQEVNIMGTESIASEKANNQDRVSVPSILDEFLELQGGKRLLLQETTVSDARTATICEN